LVDLFWGYICGKALKIPFIVSVVQNMADPGFWVRFKSRLVNKLIMRGLDNIIVVSRARKDSLIKEYNLVPEKIKLINNSVDINRFKDFNFKDINRLKKEIGISEDDKVIGMVGRLVYEKAHDIFLRSVSSITKFVPNSKFLIIGDGSERPRLEKLASSLGIRGQVVFLGERQDIPQLISLFDVAVLSSRIESFPVVLLEYMAASKPIVATNVGGNAEIIANGETGYIVPPEDPEALADAVIELFNNKIKAGNMANSAKKIAEDRFSLTHMVGKMERFFLDCSEEKFLK
jgi:glycosyltransferase involved in cell wall biosynthesis